MASIRDLQIISERFDRRPESRGFDLRLGLSRLVLRHLKAKGWSQRQLADATEMKESFITRIIHADSNCTFDVAGRLLFALGARAEIAESQAPVVAETVYSTTSSSTFETEYGKTEDIETTLIQAGGESIVRAGRIRTGRFEKLREVQQA